jgi:hypothetical protein
MPAKRELKRLWMVVVAGLISALFIPAVETSANLSGNWVLDLARSDSSSPTRRSGRVGSTPGTGGGYPGSGYPGSPGYPGGITLPGGIRLPGGVSPGIGYPGSGPAGRYPGEGRSENDGGGTVENWPGEQMQGLRLQVVQTDTEVQVTRKFTVNGEFQTVSQAFALDGSENSNPASNGQGRLVSRSTWKNDRLVNSGTQTSDARSQSYEVRVKEEYSISKDRKTLTIRTTKTTPRGETTLKQGFNRQDESELSGE